MIGGYRARPRATYREALAAVLDYRSLHEFGLVLITPARAIAAAPGRPVLAVGHRHQEEGGPVTPPGSHRSTGLPRARDRA